MQNNPMQSDKKNKSNWISIISGILAILIFLFILLVTYLPNKPEGVDATIKQERLDKANATRAEGIKALSTLEILDAEAGTVKIPIEKAMELTLSKYNK
jgi:hypothetical protein|tara:strand:+ start:365 stop:661 length:297 start_codon:yes stop_codon:yes gene_type:complete